MVDCALLDHKGGRGVGERCPCRKSYPAKFRAPCAVSPVDTGLPTFLAWTPRPNR